MHLTTLLSRQKLLRFFIRIPRQPANQAESSSASQCCPHCEIVSSNPSILAMFRSVLARFNACKSCTFTDTAWYIKTKTLGKTMLVLAIVNCMPTMLVAHSRSSIHQHSSPPKCRKAST